MKKELNPTYAVKPLVAITNLWNKLNSKGVSIIYLYFPS